MTGAGPAAGPERDGPPLIAVAHGSRDPRSAQSIHAIVDGLRAANPGIEVHVAFLDLSVPSLGDVVETVARAGHRSAVVVPLLLGSAYHSRVDLPALLAAASARRPGMELIQAPVLGDDERLVTAIRDRIVGAGARVDDPSVGVALSAVGSSSAEANAVTRALAARVSEGTAWHGARVCFAAAADPTVESAIDSLRAQGARRIVVGSWFLAPGLLADRVRRRALEVEPSAMIAEPIGPHALVPQVIVDRYRRAAATVTVAAARTDAA
ncbi:sirohydrochlorin chelatase [Tomitella fengzijianii]|uniref:Sirohydrochlorin chelatase n=1 Tax=Tomitella fengzijianii TaxID=2597660 RepID=A0A516X4U0_9ACTN|nr:sirohydrochlorin chelatase [Tomitella fengzijianii]QDQ98023.1 sirohydrochlorin chelatase [Tomitella fengzijianii]